jgi:hypothetical protein
MEIPYNESAKSCKAEPQVNLRNRAGVRILKKLSQGESSYRSLRAFMSRTNTQTVDTIGPTIGMMENSMGTKDQQTSPKVTS